MFKKIIFNAKGMNLMEMVAGAAIFGVVGTVAVKNLSLSNKEMVSTRERLKVEDATKSISDLLKRKSLCEAAISQLDVDKLNTEDGFVIKKEQVDSEIPKCSKPTRPKPPSQLPSDELDEGEQRFSSGSQKKSQRKSSQYEQELAIYEEQLRSYEECVQAAKDSQVKLDEDNQKKIETGAGTIDLSRSSIDIGKELENGIRLDAIGIRLDGSSGEVPLFFTLEFGVPIGQTGRFKKVRRVVEMQVQILDGQIVCDSFQGNEIFDTATAKICNELGGVMVGPVCDVSGGLDPELSDRLALAACEALDSAGTGVFSGGLCSRIYLNGNIDGANLGEDKLVINGDERNTFDNTDCAGYLGGYSVQGSKQCKSITFNFEGGALPNCDMQDGYSLEGDNTASETASCRQYDFSLDASVGSCRRSEIGNTEAGLCRIFTAGTCEGTTAGVVEVVPDGTVCGTGKACSAGNCIDAPTCEDTYSISGTQSATETSTCTFFDREVNFDFSGCNSSSSAQASAGVCKRIQAGTCENEIAGVVENFPDGTDCGGGKTCQAGVCTGGGGLPFCAEGVYRNESECRMAHSGRKCVDIGYGWNDSGRGPEFCKGEEDDGSCKPFWCPEPEKVAEEGKGCEIKSPASWMSEDGRSARCTEYFNPVGTAFKTKTISHNGKLRLIARHCEWLSGSYSKAACDNEYQMVECHDGKVTWTESKCTPNRGGVID